MLLIGGRPIIVSNASSCSVEGERKDGKGARWVESQLDYLISLGMFSRGVTVCKHFTIASARSSEFHSSDQRCLDLW